MSAAAPVAASPALRDLVREALPRAGVEAGALVEVEQVALSSTTSYPTAALTARLRDGGSVRLFLKDFGSSQLPKDGVERRRLREVHVYRDLLADSALGTPEYLGSLLDERGGRLWLLLELVDGVQLRECDFDAWLAAAAWLGRLHGHFAGRGAELRRSPLLVRHDEDWFRLAAERAGHDLRHFPAAAQRRGGDLLAGYDELAATMARQPQTLVHGNYRPKNVVVGEAGGETRVAPVDWEVAATGSPLYDLGHLLDGFRGERREAMLTAYGAEARARGAGRPLGADAERLLAAFCLHRVVKSLGRAVEKGFGEDDVASLLDHGEALRAEAFR